MPQIPHPAAGPFPTGAPVAAPAPPRAGGLGESELRTARRLMMLEGPAFSAMASCLGPAVITVWALAVGMPVWQIGTLATAAAAARCGSWLLAGRWLGIPRKHLILRCLGASRVGHVAVATLALVGCWWALPAELLWPCLLLWTVGTTLPDAIAGLAWFSWAADVVPAGGRGRYFGRRSLLEGAGGLAAALAAAYLLAGPHGPAAPAMTAVLGAGAAAGVVSWTLMRATPHPARPRSAAMTSLRATLSRAWSQPAFRAFLLARLIGGGSLGLAMPFLPVYLLGALGLPLTVVSGLTLGATGAGALSLLVWGRLLDRHGLAWTLGAASALAALALTALVAAGPARGMPGPPLLTVGLLAVTAACAGSGIAGLQLGEFTGLLRWAPPSNPGYVLAFRTGTDVVATGTSLLASVGVGVLPGAAGIADPLSVCFAAAAAGVLLSLIWVVRCGPLRPAAAATGQPAVGEE